MDIYLHDGQTTFRFVLAGELAGDDVQNVLHSWRTASSVISEKALLVDISGISAFDSNGLELLESMRRAGASLTSPVAPHSAELCGLLGVPIPTMSVASSGSLASKVLARLLPTASTLPSIGTCRDK